MSHGDVTVQHDAGDVSRVVLFSRTCGVSRPILKMLALMMPTPFRSKYGSRDDMDESFRQ